jgi:hypothetical protein
VNKGMMMFHVPSCGMEYASKFCSKVTQVLGVSDAGGVAMASLGIFVEATQERDPHALLNDILAAFPKDMQPDYVAESVCASWADDKMHIEPKWLPNSKNPGISPPNALEVECCLRGKMCNGKTVKGKACRSPVRKLETFCWRHKYQENMHC